MPSKINLIDTNVLVRFLVQDNPPMAESAGKLFSHSGPNSLEVKDVVLAEVVFVLKSVYEKNKAQIIEVLNELIEFEVFRFDRKLIRKTLALWKKENVSFVDAYLCALNLLGKNELVYTFDKRIGRVMGVKATEPK